MKRDQFAVIANIDGTFYLLAIPAIESGTGEDQFKALVECCEEYDLKDKVKGICFDTTASNTGTKSGTNVRFSKYEGSIMIELACRRHVMELHCKHFWENVSAAKTSGPDNPVFKRFQQNWNDIKSKFDVSLLEKLEWQENKSQDFKNKIIETISFCKQILENETFVRGDYKELVELSLMYLSKDYTTKIHAPQSVSHARFMSKGIYYLKIQLLSNQLPYLLSASQKKEVKRMAEFIFIYYSVWFSKSALTASAPFCDLKAFQEMALYRKLKEEYEPEAERVHDGINAIQMSIEKHSWYLSEVTVVLCLADPDSSDVAKQLVARKLFNTPVPKKFDSNVQSLHLSDMNVYEPNFLEVGLARFIGPNSWFIFSLPDM